MKNIHKFSEIPKIAEKWDKLAPLIAKYVFENDKSSGAMGRFCHLGIEELEHFEDLSTGKERFIREINRE